MFYRRATIGKDGAKRQPQLDGSPRFGEPLSPAAAFAAAFAANGGEMPPDGGAVGWFYQSTATYGGGAKSVRLTIG
ncbi:hypothetical protein AGMMS49959_03230 [Planctomycetales bacterium]|nr:hypothetical protein AGMMS49959_03230 [Planctomycetales bacterium]